MRKKLQSDRGIKLCLFLGFFLVLAVFGGRLEVPIVLDETGTMSNTAYLTGLDWSVNNKSMGSFYYKYFQALLYVPVFLLVKNPFLRYRVIMVLHAAIISLIPLVAYDIARKYLRIDKAKAALIACGTGSLPAVILYSEYARADMLMCAVPWFALYYLLESGTALEMGEKRKAVWYSVLVSFFAISAYMSHTRGIVLLIATVMTIAFLHIFRKKKMVSYMAFTIATVVLLIGDKLMTAYMKAKVWPLGIAHATVEVFDFAALKLIFSPKGLATMMKLLAGWLFNAFTSTFGMVAIGLIVSVFVIVYAFRKTHEITDTELLLSVYGLLNMLGSAALGMLFFFKPVYNYFTAVSPTRADRLVYGRYIVCAFGVLSFFALYTLICKKDWIRWKGKLAVVLLDVGVLGIFAWKVGPAMNNVRMTIRNFISICRFLTLPSYGATQTSYENISAELTYAGIYALVIFIILLLLSSMTKKTAIIALLFTAVNMENFYSCYMLARVSKNNVTNSVTRTIYDGMNEFSDLDAQFRKLYVEKTISTQLIQMALPDFELYGNRIRDSYKQDNIFLIMNIADDRVKEMELYSIGDEIFERGGHIYSYYVRGEELVRELKNRGYKLTRNNG